jgi:hypothetical protein
VLQVDIAIAFNIISHRVIFQELHVARGQLFQVIPFIYSSYALQLLFFFSHHSLQRKLFIIQLCIGNCHGDPLGGPLFALIHFCAFRNSTASYPSCLFFFIVDDTHIIRLVLVISQAFHHFSFQLDLVGLAVQTHKCVTWFLLGLPLGFSPP